MKKSELVNGRAVKAAGETKTARILELWDQDMEIGKIAKELGVSYNQVYNTLVRKGEIRTEGRNKSS